jgi:hypothetical protein
MPLAVLPLETAAMVLSPQSTERQRTMEEAVAERQMVERQGLVALVVGRLLGHLQMEPPILVVALHGPVVRMSVEPADLVLLLSDTAQTSQDLVQHQSKGSLQFLV